MERMTEVSLAISSPRRIRQSNTVAALQALFDHGPLSRAEIARHLGLNRSSSGNIVAELAAHSLVRVVPEDGQEPSGRAGRPGILLELDPDAAIFVGAEIGVEHITVLNIDLKAEIGAVEVEPFDGRSVSAAEAVRQAVAHALGRLPPQAAGRVEGFGLAAPAQMDGSGRVRIAPILGWRDVDLARIVADALPLDLPVMIENDANAFAFGEGYRRWRRRSGVTLFLVIETGVGGGIVIDGKLFRGGHGLAGEIGHLGLPGGGELEQVLGLEQLLRRYGSQGSLGAFLADVRDRVPAAVEVAEGWARDLAGALVVACRLIDPNRIVLGGSVAALYPLVAARVGHYMRVGQAKTFPLPEIEVDETAEAGAAFGAACMLHRRFLSLENQSLVDQAPDASAPRRASDAGS